MKDLMIKAVKSRGFKLPKDKESKIISALTKEVYETIKNGSVEVIKSDINKTSYMLHDGVPCQITNDKNGNQIILKGEFTEDGFSEFDDCDGVGYLTITDLFSKFFERLNGNDVIKFLMMNQVSQRTEKRKLQEKRALKTNDLVNFTNNQHSAIKDGYEKVSLDNEDLINGTMAPKEHETKNGIGIDRIGFIIKRELLNVDKINGNNYNFISVIDMHHCYIINIEGERLTSKIENTYTIVYDAFYELNKLGFFKEEINEIFKCNLNKLETVRKIIEYAPVHRIEVAFDFSCPEFMSYIHKTTLDDYGEKTFIKINSSVENNSKSYSSTYYSNDHVKHIQKSLICIYDRGLKMGLNKSLFRIEFRIMQKYLQFEKIQFDLEGLLLYPPIYFPYNNVIALADSLRMAVSNGETFYKLRKFIDDKPEYQLLKYILDYAYGY